jgi:hypothetical protein
MRIVVLGASGHIGRSLSYYLRRQGHDVYGYSRSFGGVFHLDSDIFTNMPASDLLINCIGVGTPEKLQKIGNELLEMENTWDSFCLEYIRRTEQCKYIYFSSGIANPLYQDDSIYCTVKMSMEEKHLALNLPIWNIRLYSIFSEFADWSSSHLLPSIVRAIKDKEEFVTSRFNVDRDYIHPFDLATTLLNVGTLPAIVEPASCAPIDKLSIISWFSERYGLRTKWTNEQFSGKVSYIPLKVPHEMSRILTSKQTIEVECMKIFREW